MSIWTLGVLLMDALKCCPAWESNHRPLGLWMAGSNNGAKDEFVFFKSQAIKKLAWVVKCIYLCKIFYYDTLY